MADSVREGIMKNLQAALATITVANGFSTTLNAVERVLQQGQSSQPPMAYVFEGDDTVAQPVLLGAAGLVNRELFVHVGLVVQQDDDLDAISASEAMNRLIADVQKKLQDDYRRGELALNTEELSVSEIVQEPGQPKLMALVEYRIPYRHSRTDPSVAG